MNVNSKLLTLMALLFAGGMATGQDFDADSVLYTPIPKVVETKRAPRKIFVDTVKNDRRIGYFFTVQTGPQIGCNNCDQGKEVTFSASTTHGVTIGKKLRTGLGIGFDSYFDWHTLPVFASASWDLLGTKNTHALFVQANYGWSKSWISDSRWNAGTTDVGGGPMFNAQAGYRIRYHDVRISLAIGTKYQRVYKYYEYPTYYYTGDGRIVQGSPSKTTVKEDLNRLIISLAIGWR